MTRRNKQAEASKKEQLKQEALKKEPIKKEPKRRKRTLSNPIPKETTQILQKLKEIRDQVDVICNEFTDIYDYQLVLENGKVVPEKNKELYMFEEEMLKLMIKLDSICGDHLLVKETRKNTIIEIQKKLKVLDEFKLDSKSLDLPPRPPKVVVKEHKASAGMILAVIMVVLAAGVGYSKYI